MYTCTCNILITCVYSQGPLLKPHIPQLVPFLLESMSSLEPQVSMYGNILPVMYLMLLDIKHVEPAIR